MLRPPLVFIRVRNPTDLSHLSLLRRMLTFMGRGFYQRAEGRRKRAAVIRA
jgi:hypothetical protein